MDTLVLQIALVGPPLIAAITEINPSATVTEILDLARSVTLSRVLNGVKALKFMSIIHTIEHVYGMGLSLADTKDVLGWFANDKDVPLAVRTAVQDFIATEAAVDAVYLYLASKEVEVVVKFKCWCF